MKKKTRDIVVNDIAYKWMVKENTEVFLPTLPTVVIWKADSKVPIFKDSLEFNDYPVTPSIIEKVIKSL